DHAVFHRAGIGAVDGEDVAVGTEHVGEETVIASEQGALLKRWVEFHRADDASAIRSTAWTGGGSDSAAGGKRSGAGVPAVWRAVAAARKSTTLKKVGLLILSAKSRL